MKTFAFFLAISVLVLIFNIIILPALKNDAVNIENQAIAKHYTTCKSATKNSNQKLYLLEEVDVYQTAYTPNSSSWQCYDRSTYELLWEKKAVEKLVVFEEKNVVLEYKTSSDTLYAQTMSAIDIQTGELLWAQPLRKSASSLLHVDVSRNTIFIQEVSWNKTDLINTSSTLWTIYDLYTGRELFQYTFDSIEDNDKWGGSLDFYELSSDSLNLEFYPKFNLFFNTNDNISFYTISNKMDTILDAVNYWIGKEKSNSNKAYLTTVAKNATLFVSEYEIIDAKSGQIDWSEDLLFVSEFEAYRNKSYYYNYQFSPLDAVQTGEKYNFKSLPIKRPDINYHTVDIRGYRKWMFVQNGAWVHIQEMKKKSPIKELKVTNTRKGILKMMEQDGFFYCYIKEKYATKYDPSIAIVQYKIPVNFESQ